MLDSVTSKCKDDWDHLREQFVKMERKHVIKPKEPFSEIEVTIS